MESKFENKKLGGIIIEGADQMGKSTFAKKLKKALSKVVDMPIVHFRKNETGMSEVDYYTQHLTSNEGPFIIDRNYVSELVYGPVYRGRSRVTPSDQREIERRFDAANYFVVVINRKDYEWEDRPEEFDREGNEKIIRGFLDKYNMIGLNKLLVDDENPSTKVQEAVDFWLKKNNVI